MATVQIETRELDRPVKRFVAGFQGQVFRPGDAGYDDARRIFNGMIDRHPRLIACCAGEADVVRAVTFARDQGLTLSVRGGGHNVAGSCLNDDGLVVDLSAMRTVEVDPGEKTVRVGGGATWADVDRVTHEYGLATPGGLVSTTGVGGLTLGGGLGHLTRKYGLSIDNLVAAEVVLADGSTVMASADEHPDLFWGLRGGGGNFGVVTAFTFRLHPVDVVVGGPVLYSIEQTGDVLRFYRELMMTAPDELTTLFAFLIVPPDPHFPADLHGKTMCALVSCYAGPPEQAAAVVQPIRAFGPPALDVLGPLPFPALQAMFDPSAPAGLQQYWKADFVQDLTDEMIEIHATYGPRLPTPFSIAHVYAVSGAANRVTPDATAYAHRDAHFVHFIGAAAADAAEMPEYISWVRDYWSALHPHAAGGYVNFLMDEGDERIRATYGANYPRLAAVKQHYDPTNLFHMNQNIKPAR